MALSADGRRAVSAEGHSDLYFSDLYIWDLYSGQCLGTLRGHTDSVTAVALTPDGRRVVSGSWDLTLRVWDLNYRRELFRLTIDCQVTTCIVAQDNRTIVAGDAFGRLHFLRVEGLD
jgi:WD40 repeat protein